MRDPNEVYTGPRPQYPRRTPRRIPDYGPSTPKSQRDSAMHEAGQIAQKRMKPSFTVVSKLGGGDWVFDRNSNAVGTKEHEDGPTHRIKPRKLRRAGLM